MKKVRRTGGHRSGKCWGHVPRVPRVRNAHGWDHIISQCQARQTDRHGEERNQGQTNNLDSLLVVSLSPQDHSSGKTRASQKWGSTLRCSKWLLTPSYWRKSKAWAMLITGSYDHKYHRQPKQYITILIWNRLCLVTQISTIDGFLSCQWLPSGLGDPKSPGITVQVWE